MSQPSAPRWTIRRQRLVVDRPPWLRLWEQEVELPNGFVIEHYLWGEEPDVVMAFVVTADEQVLFVEQYKHGPARPMLDLPAGYLDAEDPAPLDGMKRELAEETGHASERWQFLTSLLRDPNRSASRTHFFLALDAFRNGQPHLDPTEEILVHRVPLVDVSTLLDEGRIGSLMSVTGILLALGTRPVGA